MLASCGGGGGGGSSAPPVTVTPTPSPTPTPTPSASCSLSSRQAFAKAVIDEWYLFPNDVATVNASSYGDVQSYIDALLAPARAQNKDRSEEHTSELKSLMRNSYAVFCLKKKNKNRQSINQTLQ